MRKRIRINQLRVGMYVADIELSAGRESGQFVPFLIASDRQVEKIVASHVMSLMIDIAKGADIEAEKSTSPSNDPTIFEIKLKTTYSHQDLKEARKCIEDTKPHIRQVLSEARINASFASDAADAAVEKIMSAAFNNAGALIAVAKLKQKDELTFLHSLAVSALMISFGRSLGHEEADVRQFGLGGLVHDLGKMTLPEEILTKTGKLTVEETDLVRTHPQRGYELVSQVPRVTRRVLDACRYHHERYDGSGYPSRLAGKRIPYAGRLAAICDVYDALTTIRPYKRAYSQKEAINVMIDSQGHFDRKLLSAFVSRMVISGTVP